MNEVLMTEEYRALLEEIVRLTKQIEEEQNNEAAGYEM